MEPQACVSDLQGIGAQFTDQASQTPCAREARSLDGIRLEYIQPGKPQQNAYVERFNRMVRYEWLSQYYWSELAEVQDFATKWIWSYNHDRPNMALAGFTPRQRLDTVARFKYIIETDEHK